MTEAERLERLEKRAHSHDKSITALTVAIENIKDTFERMEGTQEKVSDTLAKISESLSDMKHLQKEFDELKRDKKESDKLGCPVGIGINARLKKLEDFGKYVNTTIAGAIILALLGLILR